MARSRSRMACMWLPLMRVSAGARSGSRPDYGEIAAVVDGEHARRVVGRGGNGLFKQRKAAVDLPQHHGFPQVTRRDKSPGGYDACH
mgnify:CR=1 FL=1